MKGLAEIYDIAERVLEEEQGPVTRYRLLRDVFYKHEEDREFIEAGKNLEKSRWVKELAEEQWEDGSWGRLHSRDQSTNQRIPTTEIGVERAVNLGLDGEHPIPNKASHYLLSVLQTGECRDRPEKNNRWPVGVQLFAAATLAQIQPRNPMINEVWELWVEIVKRSFASGRYEEEAEIMAHRQLTGVSVRGSYLGLRNKYTLKLLASRSSALPPALEKTLVTYIWRLDNGIGYLDAALCKPPGVKSGPLERWFQSQELIAGFPEWRNLAGDVIQWLWEGLNPEGEWDYGPRSSQMVMMPMSESWRKKGARQIDWTTRVLLLLRQFYGDD